MQRQILIVHFGDAYPRVVNLVQLFNLYFNIQEGFNMKNVIVVFLASLYFVVLFRTLLWQISEYPRFPQLYAIYLLLDFMDGDYVQLDFLIRIFKLQAVDLMDSIFEQDFCTVSIRFLSGLFRHFYAEYLNRLKQRFSIHLFILVSYLILKQYYVQIE